MRQPITRAEWVAALKVEGERVDELIEIPKHMECENVSEKKI